MKVIDLSSPIDASFWEPDPVEHRIMSPADAAEHLSAEMREHFQLDFDPRALPDAEFLSNDYVTLTTHTGTHVDAPSHYGSTTTYGVPATVDQLPLDWFVRPGCLVDLGDAGVGCVGHHHLELALQRTGYRPSPLDIVLLRTGASRLVGSRRYFTDFVGLDASGVEYLLDLGVRVIGTDAFSLDAPFVDIIERYQASGDQRVLWPAHLVGRRRPYCQIERLANLDSLPPFGFTVCCLPVKITGAGAGWARAVAFVDETGTYEMRPEHLLERSGGSTHPVPDAVEPRLDVHSQPPPGREV